MPNSKILTNIIEVLHQFAIDVFHGANAIRDCKLGNISNPLDNRRRNVHRSLGEVLAEIGKARAFFCETLLLRRQRIQPLLVLVTVVKRPRLAARLELVESAGSWLRPVLFFVVRHFFANSFFISVRRATPLSDSGSSVAPLGAAGLTRLTDGAIVLPHPGTGQAVAPANSPSGPGLLLV